MNLKAIEQEAINKSATARLRKYSLEKCDFVRPFLSIWPITKTLRQHPIIPKPVMDHVKALIASFCCVPLRYKTILSPNIFQCSFKFKIPYFLFLVTCNDFDLGNVFLLMFFLLLTKRLVNLIQDSQISSY